MYKRQVLNNILVSPEQRLGSPAPNAITLASVEVARQELQVWLDTELFIATLSENWKPEEGLKAKALTDVFKQAQSAQASSVSLQAGLRELLLSVQSPVPMTVDSEGRLIISNKFEQVYTAKSLRRLNMNRAITRLLLRSFVNDKERILSLIHI